MSLHLFRRVYGLLGRNSKFGYHKLLFCDLGESLLPSQGRKIRLLHRMPGIAPPIDNNVPYCDAHNLEELFFDLCIAL